MKHTSLRSFIRRQRMEKEYNLRNCKVIIEARSFFNVYKKSGCQYILGAECDRYADYLKKSLNCLIESGVECYVVFSGGWKSDLETRKENHGKLIKKRFQIVPENVTDNFYDPIFAKDVHVEVLDELEIKYFFCEYDSKETIVSLAKIWRAPIVTNNIEYCLYNVSCILPDSITFDTENKRAMCTIYFDNIFKSKIGVDVGQYPLLMTLLDEDSDYFGYLPGVVLGRYQNVVPSLAYWIRRRNIYDAKQYILTYLRSDSDRKMFLDLYKQNENILKTENSVVVKYFEKKGPYSFSKQGDWFCNGVSNSRIAVPYINLSKIGILSGCWLIPDIHKDDALLAAVDIIGFVHCLLTASQDSNLTFIGRKSDESCIWDIERKWDTPIPYDYIFDHAKNMRCTELEAHFDISNPFCLYLHETLKGFDYGALMCLRQESWILIITLVYYIKKRNRDFIKAAYCVILSHVMLDNVSDKVGVIKRSKFSVNHNVCEQNNSNNGLVYKDCITTANILMDLFYIQNLKEKFDCSVLHDFAEFQHCLQHLNYLNKICGEKLKCTIYNKTINGTFVYNVYYTIKDKENALEYLNGILGSSTVTSLFLDIVNVFDKCLKSVDDY